MTRRSRWPSGVPVFRYGESEHLIEAVDYCENGIYGRFVHIGIFGLWTWEWQKKQAFVPLNADARAMLAIARAK